MLRRFKKKNNSQVINIAIDEDIECLEIWIQTKLLKEANQCAYITKINKSKLLKENKIHIISSPIIYSLNNENLTNISIIDNELKQIYEIIDKINSNMLKHLKNGEDVKINGIPIEFCYSEEYLETV